MDVSAKNIIEAAMVDVSGYDAELRDGRLAAADGRLSARVLDLVAHGAGLAVCYGANALLARHGLDIHREQDAEVARDYLESIFRAFAAEVDVARYSPVAMGYDRVARMDVDGFNKNIHFTPNSDHTQSREFLTTKCVHFDAATPFIANIYGPNTNIAGGIPIVCDTREFCRRNGIDPAELIELMPHSYNVAVKERYTDAIITGHSAGIDLDLRNDMVMVVLYNEVAGGLAHAGSMPRLVDPDQPGKRPLRHIEFQFAEGADLHKWYRHYRLETPEVTLSAPEAASEAHKRYHRGVDAALTVAGAASD